MNHDTKLHTTLFFVLCMICEGLATPIAMRAATQEAPSTNAPTAQEESPANEVSEPALPQDECNPAKLKLKLKVSKPIQVPDGAGKPSGIEYTVTQTHFNVKTEVFPKTFVTSMEVFDKSGMPGQKRVAFCATGITDALLDKADFTHMIVEMIQDTQDNNKITCQIPAAQNLAARKDRLGAMGCQLITIQEGKSTAFNFVSGNDRTIPEFDNAGDPVPGKFKVVGGYGGIGPTQNGVCPVDTATGDGWGLVGGHPFVGRAGGFHQVLQVLNTLDLLVIYFKDKDLTLVTDGAAAKPPDRDDGTKFNCNKCFGMAHYKDGKVADRGATDFGKFVGYQLKPLDPAVQKKLGDKAVFVNHMVSYKTLELTENKTSSLNLNLYDDSTFFANQKTPVTYSMRAVDVPSQCTIATAPYKEGVPVPIDPQQVIQLTVSVTCTAAVPADAHGQLILTIIGADTKEILSQDFVEMFPGS